MSLKKIEHYKDSLIDELNNISKRFKLHSLLIMESTPKSMIVFAANDQLVYRANDSGPKSTQSGCHELYCERVVNTGKELLVNDASADEEWMGNEDLVKFGLGVYYGLPLMYNDEVVGTVCALNDRPFNFSEGNPSAIEQLTQLQVRIQQLLNSNI
ncbi:histidine kinase [Vibrio tasmaniensis]|nr:histidine kinase [Vibrio tasmaniensis]